MTDDDVALPFQWFVPVDDGLKPIPGLPRVASREEAEAQREEAQNYASSRGCRPWLANWVYADLGHIIDPTDPSAL